MSSGRSPVTNKVEIVTNFVYKVPLARTAHGCMTRENR
jgi:hypothetical protein